MGTAGAGPVVGLLLAHTSVAFARGVEDWFYSETQRQDISVEVFLGFAAAVHTPAPWLTAARLLPRGANNNQDLSPSQQERGCYSHKLTAEGSPKHTISFLAKRQGLRGKLAEAQRRKGPETGKHSLGLLRHKSPSGSKLLLSSPHVPRWLHRRVHKGHFGHSTYRRPEGNSAEIQPDTKEALWYLSYCSELPAPFPSSSIPKLSSEPPPQVCTLAVTLPAVTGQTEEATRSHSVHQNKFVLAVKHCPAHTMGELWNLSH